MGHLATMDPGLRGAITVCGAAQSHSRVAGGTGGLLPVELRYTNSH